MSVTLGQHQYDAIKKMHNGCILCGRVGSGKSRTALAYYFIQNGGVLGDIWHEMDENHAKLYIITTARKRDTLEWEEECIPFLFDMDEIIVDSWNNIKKYEKVKDAFFIFDEQRVVGSGPWASTFIKIAKNNQWILLSATPGDSWKDYAAVFIANGYYRSFSEFRYRHIVYKRFSKYPQIERYIDTDYLTQLRSEILVIMPFKKKTVKHDCYMDCEYNKDYYKTIMKTRFNDIENRPFGSASELCYFLRRITNSDPSRIIMLFNIWLMHKKVIVFYNFDYELDLLRQLAAEKNIPYAEWNGHKHLKVPVDLNEWLYFVQYTSGCEGWNCTSTDCMVFFSQNYSYKVMVQAAGRIDRMNTPYKDLYFYHLVSSASIDLAIKKSLKSKQNFNETSFC